VGNEAARHQMTEVLALVQEQLAARGVGRRVGEMLVSIGERRKALPALSEIVQGAPDLRDLVPPGLDVFSVARPARVADDLDGGEGAAFPTVRR
jgi:hypothetical protein